ncbi:MAG: aldehyde dehydrogenase family protein, partial [Candidatus Latescibacterota bacterium]|nr:aldehyde dehydrogenase family protein [Candidatus Latescibacterota bacterium]
MSDQVRKMALVAREASRVLAVTSGEVRNQALEAIAQALAANEERILAANAEDMEAGQALVAKGELDMPLLKRLDLSGRKFAGTVEMVRSVGAQPDPLGQTQGATELDEKLNLYRVTVPIGVIGVIFESRPDALVQIAAICLKSGNAALLKGGREATATNRVLAEVMREATAGIGGIPAGWMALLEGRAEVRALLDQEGLVDLIIPRGGNEFVQYIMHNTKIPVM